MTTTEEEDLRELGTDLAAARNSLWEPACIAQAFATATEDGLALTMQGWIDLEKIHSPILHGLPPDDLAGFEAAAAVFGLKVEHLEAKEMAHLLTAMHEAVAAAWSMNLGMAPAGERSSGEGFGAWLPLYTALVVECGLDPDAALALRVDRAFALLAGLRRSQGWQVTGLAYDLREALSQEEVANHG